MNEEKDHITEDPTKIENTNTTTETKYNEHVINSKQPKHTKDETEYETNVINNATNIITNQPKKDIPNCNICEKPGRICQNDRFKRSQYINGRRIWAPCRECNCKFSHWKQNCASNQKCRPQAEKDEIQITSES